MIKNFECLYFCFSPQNKDVLCISVMVVIYNQQGPASFIFNEKVNTPFQILKFNYNFKEKGDKSLYKRTS